MAPVGSLLGAVILIFGVGMSAALTAMVAFGAHEAGQSLFTAIPFAIVWVAVAVIALHFFRTRHPGDS